MSCNTLTQSSSFRWVSDGVRDPTAGTSAATPKLADAASSSHAGISGAASGRPSRAEAHANGRASSNSSTSTSSIDEGGASPRPSAAGLRSAANSRKYGARPSIVSSITTLRPHAAGPLATPARGVDSTGRVKAPLLYSKQVQQARDAAGARSAEWLTYLGFEGHDLPVEAWIDVESQYVGSPINVDAFAKSVTNLYSGEYSRPSRREQVALLVVPYEKDEATAQHGQQFIGDATVMAVDGFGAVTFFSRSGFSSAGVDEERGEEREVRMQAARQERDRLRSRLHHHIQHLPYGAVVREPAERWPSETLQLTVKKIKGNVKKAGDSLSVPRLDDQLLIITSKVLGKSAALRHYDRSADAALDRLHAIYEGLERNSWYLLPGIGVFVRRVNLSTKAMILLVIEADKQYIEVMRNPRILDDPGSAWNLDCHYDYNKELKHEFDIASRMETVTKKLVGVKDGTKFLVDMRGSRMTLVSEVLIIMLILWEVLLHPDALSYLYSFI